MSAVDDRDAIAALVSDLHWQVNQLAPRGIQDSAGNPYNPSYYKRGLKNAITRGGVAVADYVRSYLYKPPSNGYKKLEEADSLDLVCEALVADDTKPYAHLFTDEDREAARARLAPHIQAIEDRKASARARIDARVAKLPKDLDALQAHAAEATSAEEAVAANLGILELTPGDVVAMNRLGRAYEAMGALEPARQAFRDVIATDPKNAIAIRRLRDLERRQG